MRLVPQQSTRIRIEVKEITYHKKESGKRGHATHKNKSLTVYDTTLEEVFNVISEAIKSKST